MEIERKFLVNQLPENLEKYPKLTISQSYLAKSPSVRIRKANLQFYFCLKIPVSDRESQEIEFEINEKQYLELSEKVTSKTVSKIRYKLPLPPDISKPSVTLTAELDIYQGSHSGLVTVEVEFPDKTACDSFIPPQWFGEEISHLYSYKNVSLAYNE